MSDLESATTAPVPVSALRRLIAAAAHLAVVLTLVVLATYVFLPTLAAGFVYDDVMTVVSNHLIDRLSWDTLAQLFSGFHLNDYYPVFYTSLAIDRAIWGFKPNGYHLTNLLIHAVNAVLVYALVLRMVRRVAGTHGQGVGSGGRWVAVLAAVAFVVHPNHVEAVAWVSGRKVLLATFFGLLAVHACIEGPGGRGRRWLSLAAGLLCTILACMSNVYALVVPALIVLCDRYVGGRSWHKAVWRNVPFIVVAGGAVALKMLSRIGGVTRPGQFTSREDWLLTTVAIYGRNVLSLFTTQERNVLYANQTVDSITSPAFLGGLLAVVVTLILLRRLRHRPLWMTGLLWFILALGPTSQLARHHILRADRYLYLPGIGACLLAGLLAAGLWRWSGRWLWRVTLGLVFLVVAVRWTSASRGRTFDWKDDASLWAASLRQDERNADAHQSLGTALMRAGALDEALRHLRRAIELNPRQADAYNTMSALMIQLNRLPEAVDAGAKAVACRPGFAEAQFNYGLALTMVGRYEDAIRQFQEGLVSAPGDLGAYYHMGEAFRRMSRFDEAIRAFEKALSLNGRYIEARYALAMSLAAKGQTDRARQEWEACVTAQPEFAEAHCRLAELILAKGEYANAIARYRTAVAARPDLIEPRNNLAWILATCPRDGLRNSAEALDVLKALPETVTRDNARLWDTFGAIYAEMGRFGEALSAARKAADLARRSDQQDLARQIDQRISLYATSRPYREIPR